MLRAGQTAKRRNVSFVRLQLCLVRFGDALHRCGPKFMFMSVAPLMVAGNEELHDQRNCIDGIDTQVGTTTPG